MSALRIGAGNSSVAVSVSATNPILEYLGRWVKWIPAEVITIYAAAISQMQPKPEAADQAPVVSVPLWVIALIATPLVVLVGSVLAKSGMTVWRMLFSVPAFLVWSSTVPHSPWSQWTLFAENQILAYVVLGFLSLIFPPIFDRIIGD